MLPFHRNSQTLFWKSGYKKEGAWGDSGQPLVIGLLLECCVDETGFEVNVVWRNWTPAKNNKLQSTTNSETTLNLNSKESDHMLVIC